MSVLAAIKDVITPFLWAIFVSAVGQNVLLTRSLDASQVLEVTEERGSGFMWHSLLLTLTMFFSTLLVYPVSQLMKNWDTRFPFVPLIYVACISAVYFLIRAFVQKFLSRYTLHFDERFTAATFNCAVIGSLVLMVQQNMTLATSLGYAIGTGIGYLLACILIWEGIRRLRLCDIPKPFRGFPIMLIYIGILSLSIYGITGMTTIV